MIGNILFLASLVTALVIGFLYFRDLGDVSQMILKVKRSNMIRFIRNEYRLLAIGIGAVVVMTFAHFVLGAGGTWLYWVALLLSVVLFGFPYVWVHFGLRNQRSSAKFYSIEEARDFINPTASVMVIENNGVARAHPDAQLMRPHLAGNSEGLDGENVIMTYCAMANLGQAYKPEIDGKAVDLEVLAQHGNNLILRDNTTGEPIQQIYGERESERDTGKGMTPWPTYRMSFRGFQKAFPEGTVFLNKPSKNPLLFLLDLVTETAFSGGIQQQHQQSKPVMDNMTRHDPRLPNKTYVWGISIGDDAVCWTDDFIREQGGLLNVTVGGRALVVYADPAFESIGVWYNDSGTPVTTMAFSGASDQGQLQRVETLRSGLFWHVWTEFFPQTDINRTSENSAP